MKDSLYVLGWEPDGYGWVVRPNPNDAPSGQRQTEQDRGLSGGWIVGKSRNNSMSSRKYRVANGADDVGASEMRIRLIVRLSGGSLSR